MESTINLKIQMKAVEFVFKYKNNLHLLIR